MTSLTELVKLGKVASRVLIETLEALATNGKDMGLVEAKDVVALLDRTEPPLMRADLERLKGDCRKASVDLENRGQSWAAQDWARIVSAIETKLAGMPR